MTGISADNNDEIMFNAYKGTRPFLFISYSRADTDIVYPILRKLNEEKYRIWYDRDGLETGGEFIDEIMSAISHCCAVVFFISEKSLNSPFVQREINHAFSCQKKIVPIKLEDVTITGNIGFILSIIQHQEYSDPKFYEKLYHALPDDTKDIAIIQDGIYIESDENIREVHLTSEITEIGAGAFKNRINLAHLSISETVKSIHHEAFRNCKSLKKLTIPSNVQYIGNSCFRDCISLEEVVIEKSIKRGIDIGERAFENCSNLTKITLPEDLAEIYSGFFNSCKSLKNITIPPKVTVIGDNAFGSCDKLSEINLPASVTKIDDAAFAGCYNLDKISLPDGLSKIGKNVFKDCVLLDTLKLPDHLTKIESSAFRGCINLEKLEISSKNKFFKTVDGILFNKNKSEIICYPQNKPDKTYTIPDSVTHIREWAFSGCKNLETIIIPDSVNEIGEFAFFSCTGLKRVVIPDSVICIDDNAFRGCTGLREVIIESEIIKELGWGIFYNCSEELVVKSYMRKMEAYCSGKPYTFKLLV